MNSDQKYKDFDAKVKLLDQRIKELRSNTVMEAAVNEALAASLLVGFEAGVTLLLDRHVPKHVAQRVLGDSKLRRGTDWKH